MLTQFLTHQLDYIFFFYGLAFILLMAVCAIMYRRTEKDELPWMLLGLFGLIHGLNEWLDMLAISLGDNSAFSSFRIVMMALSFVFLTEFGRQGLRSGNRKGPGSWVYLPLLALAVSGASAGMPGLNAAVRLTFGLVGGLMAAIALWRAAKDNNTSRFLSGAAVVMALYAVAAGVIVPKAPFFPADFINHDSFLSFSGIPIQLPRAVLAVLCTCMIWGYYQKIQASGHLDLPQKPYGMQLTLALVIIVITGWIATELSSSAAMNEVKYDLLQISKISAAMMSPERVKTITATNEDRYGSDQQWIINQLTRLRTANPDMQQVSILSQNGNNIHVTADSLGGGDPGYWKPIDIYQTPPKELFNALKSGKTSLADPVEKGKKIYVTTFTPLIDDNGKTIAALRINFSPANWKERESRNRLISIGITLILAATIIAFFILLMRILKSAQLLAASQKELAETRLQKQHELEALNQNLEAVVALRTAKLSASNKELQHFAYIASHDLQEPLRTITSFIQLLAKRYRGKLDQDADEFISFVTDGAHRMQQLINDLLVYARVDSKGKPFEPFEGETVLAHALANLHGSIEESGVQISHDPLPSFCGDANQIVQLLQNLIGNAIKFRGPEPKVHIGLRESPQEWEISVKDNGIGIDPQFFERIFEIFQRLHTRERYSGTGIGLSVCKKIVERHGGKISVESEPGKGAIFAFTIRKDLCTLQNEML